jgi:hypothetical protein
MVDSGFELLEVLIFLFFVMSMIRRKLEQLSNDKLIYGLTDQQLRDQYKRIWSLKVMTYMLVFVKITHFVWSGVTVLWARYLEKYDHDLQNHKNICNVFFDHHLVDGIILIVIFFLCYVAWIIPFIAIFWVGNSKKMAKKPLKRYTDFSVSDV